MQELLEYTIRILPGLLLFGVLFFLLPRKQVLARIFVLIMGFILMRDAMTPAGFWSFGITDAAVWLRFVDNSFILVTLSVLSLIVSFALLRVKTLRMLVEWGKLRSWKPYVVGVVAGIAVALPFIAIGLGVPLEQRGGAVAGTLLPALFLMAFAGNFLEELIFRGFLQSYFAKHMASIRAALLSGITFAAAHVFLASTVTDLGWPILLFVAIEGIVCAFIYRSYGLISAAIAHGAAIFLLASGLL